MLEDHEVRISKLETNYGEVINRITGLEKTQVDTQNVLLKEFSTTKDMLVQQNNRNDTLTEHMYGIKMSKITSRKDIILGVVGGTGIVGAGVSIITVIVVNWETVKSMFGG